MNFSKTWRKVKLGEVATLHRGYDLPIEQIKKGKFPVVFSNGKIEFHNEYKIEGPGVVTGRSGTLGNTFYMEEKFWPHNTTLYVSNFHDNDPKFIYYLFKHLNFSRFNAGSGVPTLNRNHVHEIFVGIPQNLTEQKRIASTLSAFDNKIELNNKISKNLEQTAQAIFKEWFVNYRFPGYEKVRMVDSELGRIPEGWKVKNVMEIIKRISVGKKYENKTALPIGKVAILDQGQSGCIGYHDDDPGIVASINEPVIVFTNHTCNYRLVTYPFSAIQNVLPYVGIKGYPTLFVYYLTRGKITMQGYKGHWPEFEQQKFIVPPPATAGEYASFIKPIAQKMAEIEKENQKLTTLRDLLLPKLMSGEIIV